MCDRAVVEHVVGEAPQRIAELIAWGTQFDQVDGHLALGREGGHGRDRIVHALGDATGKEVMRAVAERLASCANVEVWEHTFTIDLLTCDGVCRGALVWNGQHGKTMVWAKQTILATGGAGQIYRETTNPAVATGDGMAIAYRAGAELRDMEFIQFHPTVLYIAGGSRHLISEATRGEGAWLVDRHGHRFMPDYDPRGELAPRDVVSLAIVSQMERTRHPNVYLDLTHLDAEAVLSRFPGIAAICAEFGLDITRDRIPGPPGRALHDGRRHRRLRGPNHLARPLGGRRSQRQRPARRQPAGLQQPAGGAGLRGACRRGRLPGGRRGKRRFSALRWKTRA